MLSKPLKLIHIQNLLPDFCVGSPILDLISDKMPSWRQFLPYVSRLRKPLLCQLLLKFYHPSFSCINTHTHTHTHMRALSHTPYLHMCARVSNTILTLHFCDCVIMWVKTYCSHISVPVKSLYLLSECKCTHQIGRFPKLWTLRQSDGIVAVKESDSRMLHREGGVVQIQQIEK